MKPHFYCDLCGHQVDADQDTCPNCAAKFSGVRCPSCNGHGTVEQFTSGCPFCGYQMNQKNLATSSKMQAKKKSTPKLRYPWQIPLKDLSTIATALIVATVALLLFYHLHNRI